MELPKLHNNNLSSSMINIVSDKGFRREWLDKIETLTDLEKYLFELVSNYRGTVEERQKVFHLVQIWGGKTGRNIYVMGEKGFCLDNIDQHYAQFVESCRALTGHTEADIRKAYQTVMALNDRVNNIGPSFITKHLRFWTYPNLHDDMFPPYDSVMAKNFMNKKYHRYADIVPYWIKIYKEAADRNLSVALYERNLFNHYCNVTNKRQ